VYTGITTSTYAETGADTFTDYQAGKYSHASYALSSVLFQDTMTTTDTLTATNSESMSGVHSSSLTFVQNDSSTSTYGYANMLGSSQLTFTSGDPGTYSSSDTSMLTFTSSDTSTSYLAGSYANASYSFTSLVLSDQANSTFNYQETGTVSDGGNGTSVAQQSINYNGGQTYGFHTGGVAETGVFTGTFTYNDSALLTYTLNDSATESSTAYDAGCYALGSVNLTSVTFNIQDNNTPTLSATFSDSYSGTAMLSMTDTWVYSSQASFGYTGGNGVATSVTTGNKTFTYSGSDTMTYLESDTESVTLYGGGSFANGSLALSSYSIRDSGTSNNTLTEASSDTYAGSATSYETMAGSISDNGNFGYAAYTMVGNGTYTNNSSYTLNGSDTLTAADTSTGSYSDFYAGTFANGTMSLLSLVLSDSGNDSYHYALAGTYQFFGTQTVSESVYDNGSTGLLSGGPDFNNVRGIDNYNFNHTDLFSSVYCYSAADTSTDSYSDYQAGSLSNDSVAFSSVVLQASGTDTWTMTQYSNQCFSGSGSVLQNNSLSFSRSSGGANMPTITATGGDSVNNTDVANYCYTNISNLSASAHDSYTQYDAGVYNNGCYAFTSYSLSMAGAQSYTLSGSDSQYAYESISDNSADCTVYTEQGFGTAAFSSTDSSGYWTSNAPSYTTNDSVTATTTSALSYSIYEGGAYANGSLNLSSVVFRDQGSWSANETVQLYESQGGSSSATYSNTGTVQMPNSFGGGVQTGSYSSAGTQSQGFSAAVSATATESAAQSFTSYEAGQWAGGSYSFGSLTYDGSGNARNTTALSGTWASGGTMSQFASYSGVCTDGVSGGYTYSSSSTYTFSGTLMTSGTFTLHQEGNYSNGSYSLSNMLYTGTGSAVLTLTYGGSDAQVGSNYTAMDSYSGGESGQTSYSLSEAGVFNYGTWSIGSFTLAETSYTAGTYSIAGSFAAAGGAISDQGTYAYSAQANTTFTLSEQGSYGNGSFSFGNFSCTYSLLAKTQFQESGSNASFFNYSRLDQVTHSVALAELGTLQLGAYTMVTTDVETHTFSGIPRQGAPINSTGTFQSVVVATGNFGLAAGNPIFPPAGGAKQAGGELVGVQQPWWWPTGSAAPDGSGGPGTDVGNHRVTHSFQRLNPKSVFMAQDAPANPDGSSNAAAGSSATQGGGGYLSGQCQSYAATGDYNSVYAEMGAEQSQVFDPGVGVQPGNAVGGASNNQLVQRILGQVNQNGLVVEMPYIVDGPMELGPETNQFVTLPAVTGGDTNYEPVIEPVSDKKVVKPTDAGKEIADVTKKVQEEMKKEGWRPPRTPPGENPNPGAFGRDFHERASEELEELERRAKEELDKRRQGWFKNKRWYVNVYVNEKTGKVVSIGGPPPGGVKALAGTVQIDAFYVSKGYTPKVGEVLDSTKIESVFDWKATRRGGIDPRQAMRIAAVTGKRPIPITTPEVYVRGKGWVPNPKYKAVMGLLALIGVGEAAYAMIYASEYDAELQRIRQMAQVAKNQNIPELRSVDLYNLQKAISNYLSHFTPDRTILDFLTLEEMYRILGEELHAR
jgi:hypothetical protein